MTPVPRVVLVLIPPELLQAEQSQMINKNLPNGHTMVLNSDNNKESSQYKIAKSHYIHVFTSPEIILSKKFKKNVLDYDLFSDRLYILVIDKIYLVEK